MHGFFTTERPEPTTPGQTLPSPPTTTLEPVEHSTEEPVNISVGIPSKTTPSPLLAETHKVDSFVTEPPTTPAPLLDSKKIKRV